MDGREKMSKINRRISDWIKYWHDRSLEFIF
jgi:hypothetical protein